MQVPAAVRARVARDGILAQRGAPEPGTCTPETKRCPTATLYDRALPPCCRGHLRRLVEDTVQVLGQVGLTYWADYGTLLGAVRNPLTTQDDYPWLAESALPDGPLAAGIIPHDKDADLGVLASRRRVLEAQAALTDMGYDVRFRGNGQSLKVRLSTINHTNVDVFSWFGMPDGSYTRTNFIYVDAFKGRAIPAGALLPLSTVEWEGLTLQAPAQPAAFCAFRYGPDWQTPVAANHDGVRR